jgi:hypothetical protein
MEKLLQECQAEEDERRAATGGWFAPNRLGRENYFAYDPKDKWWFNAKAGKAPFWQLK